MSAIVIRDGIVHYEMMGRGKPVVFLHGALGTWNIWLNTMQAMTAEYRSVAFDFWGFGTSAQRTDRYNFEEQTQLLDEFLSEFGLTKVVLVAHGVGSLIALKFAQKMPFAIDRMLLSSFPMIRSGFDPVFYDWTNREKDIWLRRNKNYRPLVRNFRQSDINAVNQFLEEGGDFSADQMLKSIKIPTLLVHGERDDITFKHLVSSNVVTVTEISQSIRPSVSQTAKEFSYPNFIRELHPNIHHIRLDNAGFFPMMDNPNKFNRLIIDFLALRSGESPRNLQLKEEWVRRVR